MIAIKIFNALEIIYYAIAKIIISHLHSKEDQIYRLVDEVNTQTQDRIEFAKQVVFDANKRQEQAVMKLSSDALKIQEKYQDVIKRAGL